MTRLAVRRFSTGIAALGAAFALVISMTACGSSAKPPVVPSDTGATPVVTVQVIDNAFVPAQVEIEAGQAVRWVFAGSMEHDVIAEDGSFVSELTTTGEYIHVFGEPGEFAYDCSTHPEMTGLVTVR